MFFRVSLFRPLCAAWHLAAGSTLVPAGSRLGGALGIFHALGVGPASPTLTELCVSRAGFLVGAPDIRLTETWLLTALDRYNIDIVNNNNDNDDI